MGKKKSSAIAENKSSGSLASSMGSATPPLISGDWKDYMIPREQFEELLEKVNDQNDVIQALDETVSVREQKQNELERTVARLEQKMEQQKTDAESFAGTVMNVSQAQLDASQRPLPAPSRETRATSKNCIPEIILIAGIVGALGSKTSEGMKLCLAIAGLGTLMGVHRTSEGVGGLLSPVYQLLARPIFRLQAGQASSKSDIQGSRSLTF